LSVKNSRKKSVEFPADDHNFCTRVFEVPLHALQGEIFVQRQVCCTRA
jgi:hypothetical protein